MPNAVFYDILGKDSAGYAQGEERIDGVGPRLIVVCFICLGQGRDGKMGKETTRNSNFEFLRIVAMLAITLCHFVARKYILSGDIPIRWISVMLVDFWGLGDCLFFGITSWYLCMSNPTGKKAFRRVWQLEKQLWFYAIGIFAVLAILQFGFGLYPFFASKGALAKAGLSSVAPVISELWWYPTAYVLFVLLHPFINACLRACGERIHRGLALSAFAIWGVIPFFPLNMKLSVFLFLYQYVLLSYVRWYHDDLLRSRRLKTMLLAVGLGVGICFDSVMAVAGAIGKLGRNYTYMSQPWSFPSLFVALGLLMWAYQREESHSKAINIMASATLAPYVITKYTPLTLAVKHWIDELTAGMNAGFGLMLNVVLILVMFMLCIAIDLVRQALFRVTVDRKPGAWFAVVWDCMENRAKPAISEKWARIVQG